MAAKRGTTNGNARGSSYNRAARRQWLIDNYAADCAIAIPARFTCELVIPVSHIVQYQEYGDSVYRCCRCYRCGKLLTVDTVTVDRIVPGCKGGTYARNNIRPACGGCNSETGGATRRVRKHQCIDCHREDPTGTRRPRKIVVWSGIERCATHLRARKAAA